jgi:hypothetical protein
MMQAGRVQAIVPRRLMSSILNLHRDLRVSGGCFDPIKDEFVFIIEGDRLPRTQDHKEPVAVPIRYSEGRFTVDLSIFEAKEEECALTPEEIRDGIESSVQSAVKKMLQTPGAQINPDDYVVYVPILEGYEWSDFLDTAAGRIEVRPSHSILETTFYLTKNTKP